MGVCIIAGETYINNCKDDDGHQMWSQIASSMRTGKNATDAYAYATWTLPNMQLGLVRPHRHRWIMITISIAGRRRCSSWDTPTGRRIWQSPVLPSAPRGACLWLGMQTEMSTSGSSAVPPGSASKPSRMPTSPKWSKPLSWKVLDTTLAVNKQWAYSEHLAMA